ncbi:hypothetical protein CHLRE_11g467730v5 [Chlamydomonas reinhardtii]|uniref:Uncharacterized protein n=1 Tax=Chlamydomonas reinhardtii TaxID=3055 RepID=A0A2K3D7V1_CHLRE|nr:uncharacterized protein CHLRE_11g467730v5 [Chlamydomonas reinhardtii]PNW76609.1 hypothetical protein CHLRE_11g467730v5 [Chlamydomonas reinhardtii]
MLLQAVNVNSPMRTTRSRLSVNPPASAVSSCVHRAPSSGCCTALRIQPQRSRAQPLRGTLKVAASAVAGEPGAPDDGRAALAEFLKAVLITKLDAKFSEQNTMLDAKFSEQNTKLDAKFSEQNTKLDAKFSEQNTKLDAKFSEQNAKLDAKFSEQNTKLDAKFSEQNAKLDAKFSEQNTKLDAKFSEQKTELDAKFSEQNTMLDAMFSTMLDAMFSEQNAKLDAKFKSVLQAQGRFTKVQGDLKILLSGYLGRKLGERAAGSAGQRTEPRGGAAARPPAQRG